MGFTLEDKINILSKKKLTYDQEFIYNNALEIIYSVEKIIDVVFDEVE
jgi:hypothetical protein